MIEENSLLHHFLMANWFFLAILVVPMTFIYQFLPPTVFVHTTPAGCAFWVQLSRHKVGDETATTGAEASLVKREKTEYSFKGNVSSSQFSLNNITCRSPTWIVTSTTLIAQHDWTQCLLYVPKPGTQRVTLGRNVTEVTPEIAKGLHIRTATKMPKNSSAVRSLAYIIAISLGAEKIIDMDHVDVDHLAPEEVLFARNSTGVLSGNGIVNPYDKFRNEGTPRVWPRGYPIWEIANMDHCQVTRYETNVSNASLHVALFSDISDVDSIYIASQEPLIEFGTDEGLCYDISSSAYTMFGTEMTEYDVNSFAGLFLPSFPSDRASDIWRSFILQKMLKNNGKHIAVCYLKAQKPPRSQRIIPEDWNKLMESEMDMLLNTMNVLSVIKSVNEADPMKFMVQVYARLYEHGVVDEMDMELLNSWLFDIEEAMKVRNNATL